MSVKLKSKKAIKKMKKQLRALLTGFFTETNTYVAEGTMASFTRTAGDDILKQNRGVNSTLGAYINYCDEHDVEMVCGASYLGNPSGLLNKKDYQTMRDDIMDGAKKAGSIDLLFLYFHGAACVDGVADPEMDITNGLKEILGDEIVIAAVAMDLHAKCSDELNKTCTLLSSVHMYPHIDYFSRGTEILSYLPGILDGSIKPTRHVEYLPLIFGPTTTMNGLGAGILSKLTSINARPDIIDISYMHGFPYADHKFTGGYIMVTTDNDMALAKKEAIAFGEWVWAQREELNLPQMNTEQAVHAVIQELQTTEDYKPRPKIDLDRLATDEAYQDALIKEAREVSWGFVPDWTQKPIIVHDTADNPGGGTGGCDTNVLRRFLQANIERSAFIGITDPIVAKKAHEAGVGAIIDVSLGGKPVSGKDIDGEPIKAKAYVKMLSDGHTTNRIVVAGTRWDVGLTATLIIGSMTITVTSSAWQGFDNAMTLIGGIDPKDYRLVIVKSSAHFRAFYTPIADKIFTADGPGGTTTIVTNFNPENLRGPVYPWDPSTKYPG
jgi:microcystin degradation protein MlrC